MRNEDLNPMRLAARSYGEVKQEKKAGTSFAGVPVKVSKMGKDIAERQPWAVEAAVCKAGLLHWFFAETTKPS